MTTPSHPHLRNNGAATQLIVRDTPLVLLGGEVHNSSASSLDYMEPIFDRLAAMHLNAALLPLSWELIEPVEGRFDFALVDGLIAGAGQRGLHLVFLWFGAMKNSYSSYVPGWVKADLDRFPRAQPVPGQSGLSVSLFGDSIGDCDARAFAAVMRHIREVDTDQAVVMVQVENETGLLHARRDYSPKAEQAFAESVPPALLNGLGARQEILQPEMARIWDYAGARGEGTWSDVFGQDADEVFMAWHTARFVDRVTAAGRAEYNLPMFANAWLKQGPTDYPGRYPTGGPVAPMLDVWKIAAPHIDLLAPDIYLHAFRQVCAEYHRPDNPLFIPEMVWNSGAVPRVLYAYGRHQAICCSPFRIDDLEVTHPLAETYAALTGMMPVLTGAQANGNTTGFLQEADNEEWYVKMDGVRFHAKTVKPVSDGVIPGGALLIALGKGEFVLTGINLYLDFSPVDPSLTTTEFLWLDEGTFSDGKWTPGRRLNGDESMHGRGVVLGDRLTTVRFQVHSFR